jgi:acyl-CoA thioesterase YciA
MLSRGRTDSWRIVMADSENIPLIRVVMLPRDTNGMGSIFGGVILSYIDLAAAEQARQTAPHYYVTKVMREVDFIAPVKVGDLVSFSTETLHVGKTSVTVRVLVTADRGVGREQSVKVTEAEVVLVAIDKSGRPIPVLLPS